MTSTGSGSQFRRVTKPQGNAVKNAAAWAVVLVALGLPTLITWVYFVTLADDAPRLQQTAYLIGKVSQFALPVVWILLIQRQRPKLRGPNRWELLQGAAT